MVRKTKRYQLTKDKFLSEPEQVHLRQVLKDNPGRDATLIELALTTGARATEILNVTLDDIDIHSQSIIFYGLKGSDDRDIPIKRELFNRVLALAKADSEGKPFNITYPRLVQIWHEYRPVKKGFHSLRHSASLNIYKKTKDIILLQRVLGHRSMTNTAIYSQFVYSVAEMRRALL